MERPDPRGVVLSAQFPGPALGAGARGPAFHSHFPMAWEARLGDRVWTTGHAEGVPFIPCSLPFMAAPCEARPFCCPLRVPGA